MEASSESSFKEDVEAIMGAVTCLVLLRGRDLRMIGDEAPSLTAPRDVDGETQSRVRRELDKCGLWVREQVEGELEGPLSLKSTARVLKAEAGVVYTAGFNPRLSFSRISCINTSGFWATMYVDTLGATAVAEFNDAFEEQSAAPSGDCAS